jgi:hypothetical protein
MRANYMPFASYKIFLVPHSTIILYKPSNKHHLAIYSLVFNKSLIQYIIFSTKIEYHSRHFPKIKNFFHKIHNKHVYNQSGMELMEKLFKYSFQSFCHISVTFNSFRNSCVYLVHKFNLVVGNPNKTELSC